MFRVDVDSLDAYFDFDPARKPELVKLERYRTVKTVRGCRVDLQIRPRKPVRYMQGQKRMIWKSVKRFSEQIMRN